VGSNDESNDLKRYAIAMDFESIAYLKTSAPAIQAKSATQLVALIIQSRARYNMAAELHTKVALDDFNSLKTKTEALEISEAKYRSLAETLEIKVKEQVEIIESRQRQLYSNEKLAAVGHLAAGVAHEINNPIGFIKSNISTLARYTKKLSNFREKNGPLFSSELEDQWNTLKLDKTLNNINDILNETTEGCDRVSDIVSALKGFSCVDMQEWQTVTPKELIESILSICTIQIPNDIEITHLNECDSWIQCQLGQLSQAMFGIIMNAVDALSGKNNATIIIKSESIDNGVVISIADNGTGIPEDKLEKILIPFYTTKPVGSGTGLGLSVCRDVVLQHKGKLEINSTLGRGTTITLYLPLKSGPENE
jgi:two-component system NtrC family sensor kinase